MGEDDSKREKLKCSTWDTRGRKQPELNGEEEEAVKVLSRGRFYRWNKWSLPAKWTGTEDRYF